MHRFFIFLKLDVALVTDSYSMQAWNHMDVGPTALYVWQEAEVVRENPKRRYKKYSDTLDVLTHHQVMTTLILLVGVVAFLLFLKPNYSYITFR